MHIFQNRFLRWNREIKPVVLSIMKPINKKTFFSPYKGAGGSLGGARGRSSRPRRELKFFGESYISMFNGKISCANSESNFGSFWTPLLDLSWLALSWLHLSTWPVLSWHVTSPDVPFRCILTPNIPFGYPLRYPKTLQTVTRYPPDIFQTLSRDPQDSFQNSDMRVHSFC